MNFDSYAKIARDRGAMGFEVYQVTSTIADASKVDALRDDHLAYMAGLEASGHLMLAGPLSDTDGAEVAGGSIILRAKDMDEARTLIANDPMHKGGARRFELRRWLINEGGFTINLVFRGGAAKFV
jgi:uncharacterized protein YciI